METLNMTKNFSTMIWSFRSSQMETIYVSSSLRPMPLIWENSLILLNASKPMGLQSRLTTGIRSSSVALISWAIFTLKIQRRKMCLTEPIWGENSPLKNQLWFAKTSTGIVILLWKFYPVRETNKSWRCWRRRIGNCSARWLIPSCSQTWAYLINLPKKMRSIASKTLPTKITLYQTIAQKEAWLAWVIFRKRMTGCSRTTTTPCSITIKINRTQDAALNMANHSNPLP